VSSGRAPASLALVALAAAALSACESTQDTSKRLSKFAKRSVANKIIDLGRVNPDVRVTGTTLLHDSNGTAVVVDLESRSARSEAQLPIGIDLRDAGGRSLYRNDIQGLDPSLISVAFVGGQQRTFWIDDQILVNGKPRRTEARIGAAKATVPAQVPRIVVRSVSLGADESGVYAKGIVENRSKVPQRRLVISCVARRGGRVVAAGRAIVDRLLPAPTKKPTYFTIYFIGNPKGARLEISAPPTSLG
jgi:hypothetical protein